MDGGMVPTIFQPFTLNKQRGGCPICTTTFLLSYDFFTYETAPPNQSIRFIHEIAVYFQLFIKSDVNIQITGWSIACIVA